jgi:hypothetical protein
MIKRYGWGEFVILMSIGLLIGCDPAFQYYIEAGNDDVVVEVRPSLESLYCPDLNEICDFATSRRIKDGTYQLKSGDKLRIYGGVGTQASVNRFPFDFVKIIHRRDTLLLKGKEQILGRFVRSGNSNKHYLTF